MEVEGAVRLAAFSFLGDLQIVHGDAVPRAALAQGFDYGGTRVPLLGPQGIFKPAILGVPLSITTVPVREGRPRPYDDEWLHGDLIRYRYRGTDPHHRDNAGLRTAMREQLPLVYLHGIVEGWYAPVYPVYIASDDPASLTFTVAADEYVIDPGATPEPETAPRRAYVTRLVRQRLHQAGFRQRVIRAYQERCAVCRLRHRELLDAAHILPDGHPLAEPTVPNGLAMCRLHHAAFDSQLLGVRPDFVIEIRQDVLDERDGPMLVHGLQGFQGGRLVVPRRETLQPNRDFLAERYERFRAAG